MRLAESVQSLLVLDDIGVRDRDQAFAAMLNQMSLDGLFPSALVSVLQTALIRRDELGPTGIGEGVAIPHVWHAELDRVLAALAVSRGGLDYPSLDGEPVHLILLILTPPGAAFEPAKQQPLRCLAAPPARSGRPRRTASCRLRERTAGDAPGDRSRFNLSDQATRHRGRRARSGP